MTRIYYYWVIYLCCNGGQSAWQGSWHTHDTWRPGHDSCHNRYLVTACDQELRPPGQCWVIITTLCRIKSWRGQTLGPQLCWVRGLKHQDTHKGSPLFKIKAPCASEDLFWLDWVLASELTRHGWQWSCSHKRQFSPQARFWFFRRLNPVSNVRWEEGRKETTTLLLISRGFSTWDS